MPQRDAGFSLVETLIAATITIVAVAALAQLFVISSAANVNAKAVTLATVLAQDKCEELLAWESSDRDGVDFLDGRGHLLGSGIAVPPAWAYVRRWSIRSIVEAPASSAIDVVISRAAVAGEAARIVGLRHGEAVP